MMKFLKNPAMSFLEVIIVVAIFTVLIAAAGPPMVTMLFSNQMEIANQELVHAMRHAHERATTQIHDSSWGVYLDTSVQTYTMFAGDDFAGRDMSFDINYSLPVSVTFGTVSLTGGGAEVVFDQVTGETSQDGTIDLESESEGARTITINPIGNVF